MALLESLAPSMRYIGGAPALLRRSSASSVSAAPAARVTRAANRLSTSHRGNAFDALRLFAAGLVLVSHCWAIAIHEDVQPAIGELDLGTIGVRMFFGISGFLIAQSWLSDPHLYRFAVKRALRILPALYVVLIATTLILGLALTTLPASDYLRDGQTWRYLLYGTVFFFEGRLPGVFEENPSAQVNGPLWTLAPEVLAYAGLATLGLIGALRRSWVPPLVAAVLVLAWYDPTGLVPRDRALVLFQTFAVGTSLYVLRDRIPWHWAIVAALLVGFALLRGGLQWWLAVVAIPYASIFIAYRAPAALRRITARGDVSYGLYLLGWPIGQAVVALSGGSASPWFVVAISLPVAYVLAHASWRFVERPALALKSRVVAGSRPERDAGGRELTPTEREAAAHAV